MSLKLATKFAIIGISLSLIIDISLSLTKVSFLFFLIPTIIEGILFKIPLLIFLIVLNSKQK